MSTTSTVSSASPIGWRLGTNVHCVSALPELVDELFQRPVDDGVTLALLIQHRGKVVAERYGIQPENIFQPAIQITAESTLTSCLSFELRR